MKVHVANADEGGCGFYRLVAPANVLIAEGYDITLDKGASSIMCTRVGEKIMGVEPIEADVVVLQRPLDRSLVDAIPFIQAQGIAVVVELDDDFWSVDRRSVAYRYLPNHNYDHLARACKMADLVTVSTPALANKVPTNKTKVLRNMVPESYFDTPLNPEANWSLFEGHLVVGWTGSPMTHVGDVGVMGESLVNAVRETDSKFFAIGSPSAGQEAGFRSGESAYTPPIVLENYPQAVKGLDLGIVPLKLTEFNEAKSYLKGLEYASLGVPFVASPTGEYRRLSATGCGDLASYRHEWYKTLKKLLTDEPYRIQRAYEGFDVAQSFTYERNAWQWAETWERAIVNFKTKATK